jgi:hypothetical protein
MPRVLNLHLKTRCLPRSRCEMYPTSYTSDHAGPLVERSSARHCLLKCKGRATSTSCSQFTPPFYLTSPIQYSILNDIAVKSIRSHRQRTPTRIYYTSRVYTDARRPTKINKIHFPHQLLRLRHLLLTQYHLSLYQTSRLIQSVN